MPPGVLGVLLLKIDCFMLIRLLEALVHREISPFLEEVKLFFALG